MKTTNLTTKLLQLIITIINIYFHWEKTCCYDGSCILQRGNILVAKPNIIMDIFTIHIKILSGDVTFLPAEDIATCYEKLLSGKYMFYITTEVLYTYGSP